MKTKVIQKSCMTCNRNFDWEEMTVVKSPECVPQCLDCADKYKDDKIYTGEAGWLVTEYRPGAATQHAGTLYIYQ